MRKHLNAPWKAVDVGDGKTDVVDRDGKYVIEGDHQLSLLLWQHIVGCVNIQSAQIAAADEEQRRANEELQKEIDRRKNES